MLSEIERNRVLDDIKKIMQDKKMYINEKRYWIEIIKVMAENGYYEECESVILY